MEIWQVHPFREGNTRVVVMLMTFFVEHYGYYMDSKLLADSAEYVRNSFVLASFGEHSEYGHLEKILLDAVSLEPIKSEEYIVADAKEGRYTKYQSSKYQPNKHEAMPKNYKQ